MILKSKSGSEQLPCLGMVGSGLALVYAASTCSMPLSPQNTQGTRSFQRVGIWRWKGEAKAGRQSPVFCPEWQWISESILSKALCLYFCGQEASELEGHPLRPCKAGALIRKVGTRAEPPGFFHPEDSDLSHLSLTNKVIILTHFVPSSLMWTIYTNLNWAKNIPLMVILK